MENPNISVIYGDYCLKIDINDCKSMQAIFKESALPGINDNYIYVIHEEGYYYVMIVWQEYESIINKDNSEEFYTKLLESIMDK
jgi:hypothetical protein